MTDGEIGYILRVAVPLGRGGAPPPLDAIFLAALWRRAGYRRGDDREAGRSPTRAQKRCPGLRLHWRPASSRHEVEFSTHPSPPRQRWNFDNDLLLKFA